MGADHRPLTLARNYPQEQLLQLRPVHAHCLRRGLLLVTAVLRLPRGLRSSESVISSLTLYALMRVIATTAVGQTSLLAACPKKIELSLSSNGTGNQDCQHGGNAVVDG